MSAGYSWVTSENCFFEQGDEFSIQTGWMSIDEAKQMVEGDPDNALGVCVQQGGDPDQSYCAVVKLGTAKYEGEGFDCLIYKVELPGPEDCFEDENEGIDEAGHELQRPGRGQGLGDGVRNLTLFSGIDPNDMHQGGLGDCWLISAFAAMAEFPDAVMGLFDRTTLSPEGQYTITLYSYADGDFVPYTIDDRLPVQYGQCAYSHLTAEGEIWPCLLEKAFAVYSGGYNNLEGGVSIFAFGAMTGCTDLYTINNRQDDGTWQECQPTWTSNNTDDADYGYVTASPSDDEVLATLVDADANDYLICCGSTSGSDKEASASGVVQGHAYTILTVKEDVCGSGFTLLQLRNPWGQANSQGVCEWTGDWSDDSELWDEHPDIKEECAFQKAVDGLFWISWDDFIQEYASIYLCKHSMGTNRGKKTQAATREINLSPPECGVPERVNPNVVAKKQAGEGKGLCGACTIM